MTEGLRSKQQFEPVQDFLTDRGGTTAVEYGVLSAFVGLALFVVADIAGVKLAGVFEGVGKTLNTVVKSGGSSGSGGKSGPGKSP